MSYERLTILFDKYVSGGLTEAESQEFMGYISNAADPELEVLLKHNWAKLDAGAVFTKDQSEQILKKILNASKQK